MSRVAGGCFSCCFPLERMFNESVFIKVDKKKELFHLKNGLFLILCMCGDIHMNASALGGQAHQMLPAGNTGICELPDVGSGN